LAGAGALVSTANDLLLFLAAQVGLTPTVLRPAIERSQQLQHSADVMGIAFGWHQIPASANGYELIWHNGGTGGYQSFLGFNKGSRTGVVVLVNSGLSFSALDLATGTQPIADSIGMEALNILHGAS
jgi:CubicO group peptidase (beta-lactamase class C family)